MNLHILLNIVSKATLNIQESRKSIKCLKRQQELIKKVKIHCVLLSHELLCINILHINLHILFTPYYLFQDKFKNQKIIKIQQLHQKIHAKQLLLFYFKLFSIGNSFEFKLTRETRLI